MAATTRTLKKTALNCLTWMTPLWSEARIHGLVWTIGGFERKKEVKGREREEKKKRHIEIDSSITTTLGSLSFAFASTATQQPNLFPLTGAGGMTGP